jgi:hypothetical protein
MTTIAPPRRCDPEAEHGEGHDLFVGACEEGPYAQTLWMKCRDCGYWWERRLDFGYEGVT